MCKVHWLLGLLLFVPLLVTSLPTHAAGGDASVQQLIEMAENMKAEVENEVQSAVDRTTITSAEFRVLQEKHKMYLLLGLLLVTPIFLFLELWYIRNCTSYTAESIVHGTGLVLIIQATILVVIASPTTEQLTAAIGVLGAIAGYLFGTAKRQVSPRNGK